MTHHPLPLVSSDSLCALGLWLGGAGRQSDGGQPAFAALRDAHREFHSEVGTVLTHAQANERIRARRRLLSTFAQRSAGLMTALDNLAQIPEPAGNHAGPAPVWDDFNGQANSRTCDRRRIAASSACWS